MRQYLIKSPVLLLALLTGCVSVPNGPSRMALPGTGKDFQQFNVDDNTCRQYALNQIGGKTVNQQAEDSFAKTAILGTAIGTAIGAAAGGGHGAGVGAAAGLATGSMIGASASNASSYESQQRYDNAYTQCMYASGHRVAVPASMGNVHQHNMNNLPPQNNYLPPPPPPGYGNPVP
jgi:hypothetical protein